MATPKPKKVWDNCQLIGDVMKSASKRLRVELVAKDGIKYINIRGWYKRKADEVWMPELAGIAVPVLIPVDGSNVASAEQLIKHMQEALIQAPSFEIENEANAVWYTPKEK